MVEGLGEMERATRGIDSPFYLGRGWREEADQWVAAGGRAMVVAALCGARERERGNVVGKWAAWRVVSASIYMRGKAVEGPGRAHGPRAAGRSNGGSVARFGRS
jgi:hypothetical protein